MDRNDLVLFGGIGCSLSGLMILNAIAFDLAFKANIISNFEAAYYCFITALCGGLGAFCVKSLINKEKGDNND